jgi:membrane protease YdiL (CAAX protease family)
MTTGRHWRFGLVGLAAAAAWLALAPTPWPARIWAVLLLVPLPVLASAQTRLIAEPQTVPRIPVYASSAISLWMLAFVTAPVSMLSGFTAADLGLRVPPPGPFLVAAAGVTVAAIAILFIMSAAGIRESPLTRRLIPVSRREKLAFTGLSVTAGICEEFVFRGFLLYILIALRGPTFAVLLSSAAFGWLHAYQHPGGAFRAALLGALLCVPPLVTGSILPAVVAHAAIDIIAGLFLARRLVMRMA